MADLRNIEYNGVTFTLPTGGGVAGTLGDLSDVGLSTSPPVGALLGFDGTEWKDVELTGGGATSVTQTANGLQVYSSPYNLPNASDTVLGGVKVGAGLQIDGSGVLSATGGGGSGGLTEYEALTGVKNMLDVGSYPYIGVNNDGSLRIPATGSNGATLTITRDFRLADYGLAQGDKVVVTGIPSGFSLKHARYSTQNITGSLSSDPDTWTISAADASEGRIVLTLYVPGNFAGANAKIMFRKEGIASSEFQPFALGNAALTSSLRYLTEKLGCKNLLPAYQSADGFTVAADGGITVPTNASSDKRFVIASGLIDNGVVKAGQQYYLSGIDATTTSAVGSSLAFEYELGGATQTVTAALATDTLVDIPAGATGGSVVLTRLGSVVVANTLTVYPMLRDARMADAQYQKPAAFPYSSLASLSDTNIPANPTAGSILAFQNGKWGPTAAGTAGVTSFAGRTGDVTPQTGDYTAAMVGLGNVDNTSDANKPISTATQAALDGKADTATVAADMALKANTADLATVATTGLYSDLTGTPTPYSLPTASGSELGGIKIGTGLSINAQGVVTVDMSDVTALAARVTALETLLSGFAATPLGATDNTTSVNKLILAKDA